MKLFIPEAQYVVILRTQYNFKVKFHILPRNIILCMKGLYYSWLIRSSHPFGPSTLFLKCKSEAM